MTSRPTLRTWVILLFAAALACISVGVYLGWRARHLDDDIRKWVVKELSKRFDSEVRLNALRVTPYPELKVTGEELSIFYRDRTDLPPLIHVDKFVFGLHWTALWKLPGHISSVELEN